MHKVAKLRLGTRGSPLAMAQARSVAAAIVSAHGWDESAVEIVIIRTTGDKVQDRPLAEIGGKALWTKEIDHALLCGAVDVAVHSTKDIESLRPARTCFAATLPRADVRERLIGIDSLAALRPGMRVGTTSPRRTAQLHARCAGLVIVPFRGNVATRLRRIADGEADATLLAAAGLARLGLDDVGTPVSIAEMLPAPGQGAIGVECRADDAVTLEALSTISDAATMTAVAAERALAAALGGSCHSPVAALAEAAEGRFRLRAEILTVDGSEHIADSIAFDADGAVEAGRALAQRMLGKASPLLRQLFTIAG